MSDRVRRFQALEHVVGTDRTLTITLLDAAGVALSVVGATASWKLYAAKERRRRKPFTGAALATKTTSNDVTLATGSASIAIADTDLENLSGEYWHTLAITDSSGNVTFMGGGPIFLIADPT